MRRSVDHALVERLLQDESLSYREIARRAQCSDFSVRAISKELAGDDFARDDTEAKTEPLTPRDWAIFCGIAIAIFGGIWLLARRLPPMDGAM